MKLTGQRITERAYRQGMEAGARLVQRMPESACVQNGRIVLTMRNGATASIPISLIPVERIACANALGLAEIELGGMGEYVWFPKIGEGYAVPALLDLSFGAVIRAAMRHRGGSAKTAAKAAAARRNGKKGGRPRKTAA